MNKVKAFFSNNLVLILAAALALAMVAGAAALFIAPASPAADTSTCKHQHYKNVGSYLDSNGDQVYTFRCTDCRATIRETPGRSAFALNKPTVVNGEVLMNSPWEIGAYYGTEYKVFTQKTDDDWYTNVGTLWKDTTGIRITNTRINLPTTPIGNAAITYTAESDCFVRPSFDLFKNDKADKSAAFAIYKNGERVYPADSDITLEAAAANTQVHEDLNADLADTWITLEEGDRISFVLLYNGTNSAEFSVFPVIEYLTFSPLRK